MTNTSIEAPKWPNIKPLRKTEKYANGYNTLDWPTAKIGVPRN